MSSYCRFWGARNFLLRCNNLSVLECDSIRSLGNPIGNSQRPICKQRISLRGKTYFYTVAPCGGLWRLTINMFQKYFLPTTFLSVIAVWKWLWLTTQRSWNDYSKLIWFPTYKIHNFGCYIIIFHGQRCMGRSYSSGRTIAETTPKPPKVSAEISVYSYRDSLPKIAFRYFGRKWHFRPKYGL